MRFVRERQAIVIGVVLLLAGLTIATALPAMFMFHAGTDEGMPFFISVTNFAMGTGFVLFLVGTCMTVWGTIRIAHTPEPPRRPRFYWKSRS